MPEQSKNLKDLHLYRSLLATVVQSRMTMETASARADILLNIFLITVEPLGTEEHFVDRVVRNLELDMLDARDTPEQLRDATADLASTIWAYRMNPNSRTDQDARDEFERWQVIFQQSVGETAAEAYMDIENARSQSEPDYYSEPPLPYITRARLQKMGHQN